MKRAFTLFFVLCAIQVFAQQSGSFSVGGDPGKFYPVTFIDNGWNQNIATELSLGRSSVHLDGDWTGSLIAKFRFHTSLWGNGAGFMDANIMQINNDLGTVGDRDFIAGWADGTGANNSFIEIIWLRGGGVTYYYNSNVTTSPTVYDGVQNALPFAEQNGPSRTYKTALDDYVNSNGISQGNAYFTGLKGNYFAGDVTIGTSAAQKQLAVNGNIRAREVRVETSNWPDYVFKKSYELPSLDQVKTYIDGHGHLRDLPSEQEVAKQGVSLGEMNKLLLKKIEELTLYLIENDKELKSQRREVETLKQQLKPSVLKAKKKALAQL